MSDACTPEEISKLIKTLRDDIANGSETALGTKPGDFKWTEALFSWTSKKGFRFDHYKQVTGNCWAIGLSRGHTFYVHLNDIDAKPLTPEILLAGVSPKLVSAAGGIPDFEMARDFLVSNGYVKDMAVHRLSSDDNEGFEQLIEMLLLKGPVAVRFDCPPSYFAEYDGKGVYRPSAREFAEAAFEGYLGHVAVVTGFGATLEDGKLVEFWEVLDSQGYKFGNKGIIRLARRHGVLKGAVQFKF